MREDRLNTLSILSIESEMIAEDIDFDKKIIKQFSQTKNRRMDFIHKITPEINYYTTMII